MSGPIPKIAVALNQPVYEKCCDDMDLLTLPPVRFKKTDSLPSGRKCYGVYRPATNSIDVMTGPAVYTMDGYRYVVSELVMTLLHEMRHAQQHQDNGHDWYGLNVVFAERDAEDFAHLNVANYRRMVLVTRKFHGNGMSRLAATERRIGG